MNKKRFVKNKSLQNFLYSAKSFRINNVNILPQNI